MRWPRSGLDHGPDRVRRNWPQTIISWTRLTSGRLRDPLVGRDLVSGIVLGLAWVLVFEIGCFFQIRAGAAPRLSSTDYLLGTQSPGQAAGTRSLGDRRGWGAGASVGSASDVPFHSIHETIFSAAARYEIPSKERNSWVFLLNYSNNRTFLNNVPLPGVALPMRRKKPRAVRPAAHRGWRVTVSSIRSPSRMSTATPSTPPSRNATIRPSSTSR